MYTIKRELSDEMDAEVVFDASYMCDEGVLERMVTGDKGDAERFLDGYADRYGLDDTLHFELCAADIEYQGQGQTAG